MANKKDYFLYENDNASHLKLGDFIQDISSVGFGLDIKELLNYYGDGTKSNATQLYNSIFSLNKDEAFKHESTLNTVPLASNEDLMQIPFPIGTVLHIPFSKIDRSYGIIQSTNFVDSSDYEGFIAEKLFDLLNQKQYRSDQRSKKIETISDIFTNITVWIWSRNLSRNISGDNQDVLVDVTPFISNLTTNVTETGGNFSFDVSPILSEFKNDYQIDLKTVKIDKTGTNVSSDVFFHSVGDNDDLKRNQLYFNNIFNHNDVVFIRFEKLELENNRAKDYSFEVDKSELPNKTYDMIGLIDSVNESFNGTNNDLSLNISGRDLVKLFIEDGVYFYPFQFTNDSIFANYKKSGATNDQLLRYDGQIQSRFQTSSKTIDNSIKYIINALSTIEICSNTLFEKYEDKRTKVYQLLNDKEVQSKNVKGESKEREDEIIELIKQARKKDNLDKYNEITPQKVYSQIQLFLRVMIDSKYDLYQGETLLGWKQFNYSSEQLKNDSDITERLDDELYRAKYAWHDSRGNIISDSERKAAIDNAQKKLDGITSKVTELLKDLGQDNVDMEISNELDKAMRASTAKGNATDEQKRYRANGEQFYNNYRQLLLEKNKARVDQVKATAEFSNASTQQIINNNEELKLKEQEINKTIDDLNEKYKQIQNGIGDYYLVGIPTNYVDMSNEFAKQAIQKTYELIKNEVVANQERQLGDVNGIWQIIKLVVDDSVANRRVIDPTIGNEHGSLLNALNKICVKPFAELYTDTYKDQFYIIVRKQPFDKKSILSYIKKTVSVGEDNSIDVNKATRTYPRLENYQTTPPETADSIVIEIKESDVINTSLTFDSTCYSWYKINPINLMGGGDNKMAFAYLKAIYFPEYANIYGSKPLDVVTNYQPYYPIVDKNQKIPNAFYIRQGLLDLRYLIESNCYLPFTRTGTIIINGDRTIKRGTYIKLQSTNEIFYVDSVSNSYSIGDGSIDRITTLTVSRGMVQEYIEGLLVNGTLYSYFNLINLEIDDSIFFGEDFEDTKFSEAVAAQWQVNKEVFNFFMKKWQFAPQNAITPELQKVPWPPMQKFSSINSGDKRAIPDVNASRNNYLKR